MLEQLDLTDEEREALEGDRDAIAAPAGRLADTPTPADPTPKEPGATSGFVSLTSLVEALTSAREGAAGPRGLPDLDRDRVHGEFHDDGELKDRVQQVRAGTEVLFDVNLDGEFGKLEDIDGDRCRLGLPLLARPPSAARFSRRSGHVVALDVWATTVRHRTRSLLRRLASPGYVDRLVGRAP
jgi:hypothetical protein